MRNDDFSPGSHRAVSLQVAPFLRDFKGRGYRRRADQKEKELVYRDSSQSQVGILIDKNSFSLSAALPYDPFRSIVNNWHECWKINIWYASTFEHHLDSLPSNSIIFVFIYLSRRKPRLGEYTTPSSLCSCQYPPEVSHCSDNRVSVSSGKGLNLITNYAFLLL